MIIRPCFSPLPSAAIVSPGPASFVLPVGPAVAGQVFYRFRFPVLLLGHALAMLGQVNANFLFGFIDAQPDGELQRQQDDARHHE